MAKIPLKKSLQYDRPTGAQPAMIIDITEPFRGGKFGNEQIIITFELAATYNDTDGTAKHFMHSEYFTLSIHEKSALRKILLSGMTGQVLTDEFFQKNFPDGFDTDRLIKKPCVLVLQPTEDGYQKLIAVMPPTPEATAIVPTCTRPEWITKRLQQAKLESAAQSTAAANAPASMSLATALDKIALL